MIQKFGFVYDTQVLNKEVNHHAVKDGFLGRNKYIVFGHDGYRQIKSAKESGLIENAVHWITTLSGLKPAYKATEYLCTDHGRKIDNLWNQLKGDLNPKSSAELSKRELSFEDCEHVQKDHPIHNLPSELICRIFSFLDVPSVSRITQTCKEWKGLSETTGVDISNYHLNPVMIELKCHKAGKFIDSHLTQVDGSTKVVKTIDLIKESHLGEKNFGVFFDPWNKAGIVFRYISRSLNEEGKLIESKSVLAAIQVGEKGWTGKTIHKSSKLFFNIQKDSSGVSTIKSHDPAQILVLNYVHINDYLARLVSGAACGGMVCKKSHLGRTLSLEEGDRLINERPVIQIEKDAVSILLG